MVKVTVGSEKVNAASAVVGHPVMGRYFETPINCKSELGLPC